MERRHSTTSESSTDSSTHTRQLSNDNAEIPTVGRGAKVTAPKPPANALQFVKTGPADLYRSAQEQLKKVEELKKATKQIRDEAEDWQSNLDNWKFSRRKRQEHIIERVVEVKKYELEEHERNRRRSKTFNEMIQDRNTRGRKTSLPVYHTDESNDLSDLGLGFTEKQYSEDNSTNSNDSDQGNEKSDLPKILENENEKDTDNNNIYNGCQINGFREKEMPDENSEVEEYTYERAIQSYVNFAETRVKSRSTRSITEDTKPLHNGSTKDSPPVPSKPRRSSVASQKIETSISQLEQKKKSISTNDLVSDAVKKQPDLPKVDISKRKELFEKCRESEETTKKVNRLSSEVPTTRSIRDRLSSLKEQTDTSKSQTINKPPTEISVKDRLSSIEKLKDNGESNLPKRKSNDQLATQSIKDRLSNLEKVKNSPKVQSQTVETSVTIKDRLNSLQSACNKETPRTGPEKETQLLGEKLSNFQEMEAAENSYQTQGENYEQVLSAEDVYESSRHRHYRHRSLDSLDVDNDGASNETFERVQSLEDLDYCRNYPASSLSGDTDREDSGIHTADVSSSVSQADDYDLHLEANSVIDDLRVHHQPTIIEEIKQPLTNDSLIPNQDVLSYDFNETTNQYNTEPVTLENLSEPAFNPLSKVHHENICTSPILAKQVSSPDKELNNKHLHEDSVNISPSNQIETFTLENESKLVNNDCMLEGGTQKSNNRSDRRRTVVEICFKVDSSDLKSPPVTPFISVDVPNTFCNEKVPNIVDMKTHEQEIDGIDIYCDLNTEYINGGSKFENPVSVTSHENRDICENDITKPEMYNSSNILIDSNGLDSSVIITDTKTTVSEQVFLPKDSIQNICYSQMGELFVNLNMDQEVESVFQLSPTALEPPKEKPPPPPTDMSDDETETNAPKKPVSLRRLDSTKRIKKEIRQKRSSFLGIEGNNDDSYLDPELELIRPPDMTTLLAEERRMERQLYRQSVCSESDSNQESRDSGVELDHKNHDLAWSHSRNDSETFGNQSTTSEEDEIMRKEREIIETLEQEERIRKQDLGEKLALRLRQLEAEKGREEWERIQQNELLRSTHQNHVTERNLIHALPQKPCSPTKESLDVNMQESMEIYHNEGERFEVRENQEMSEEQVMYQHWYEARSSLQDISHNSRIEKTYQGPGLEYTKEYRGSMQDLTEPAKIMDPSRHIQIRDSHGRSMPDLQEVCPRRPPPPPPTLPSKPRYLQHQHTPESSPSCPQQMSRQTLHALSAAPRSRLISNDTWQAKRKPRQDNYNYQHWLIQEAEHRRITEQQQRQSMPGGQRASAPKPNATNPGQWTNGVNQVYQSQHHPAYTTSHPPNQQWSHQHRDSKPLPDSIIQTLTQRVQNRMNTSDTNNNNRRRYEGNNIPTENHEKMLSVSGKKRCSHCGEELGRGAAMIIESLRLFYHIDCFKCCVCCMQLGNGLMGTDVRVRNNKLHCHNCYSSDDGVKFSCV